MNRLEMFYKLKKFEKQIQIIRDRSTPAQVNILFKFNKKRKRALHHNENARVK